MLIRVLLLTVAMILSDGLQTSPRFSHAQENATTPTRTSQELLPTSTKAWFSVQDIESLETALNETNFGAMAKDEKLKPFVDSMKEQFQKWLNEKNVRLGFKVEQLQEINAGEICIAGVLQNVGDKPSRGSHGMALLVNVENAEEDARKLLAQIIDEVKSRGAVSEPMDPIHGITIQRLKLKKERLNRTFMSYYAIHSGWLVASDNESVFRETLRRLAKLENLDPSQSLAAQGAFNAVMANTELPTKSHFRWYLDPFGYAKLAQAIADEERLIPEKQNNRAAILEKEGFDAFRGLGGQVAFNVKGESESEVLHRTFLYAPRDKSKANQQRVFELFDFSNQNKLPLTPHVWIPSDASTHISFTWDFKKAFDNFGFLVDALMEKGVWEATIKSMKDEPAIDVDLRELVQAFGSEVTIMSATEEPVDEDSENVVVGIPMTTRSPEETREVFDSIHRILGRGNAKLIKLRGFDVVVHDTTEALEGDPDLQDLVLDDPDLIDADEQDVDEEAFHLFEKRYFAVRKFDDQNYLILSNNKDYMAKILSEKVEVALKEKADYQRVMKSLGKLVDQPKVSFRQFARTDKAMKVNYEMMRQGKMGSSKTVLARILNQAMLPEDATPEEIRQQQLDGSKLPSDFDNEVAKYFGPSGWAIETEEDGWRLTGCILKKKPQSEIVRKPAEGKTR